MARALLYQDLVRASRDVGGLIGGGGQAAVESHDAASRLQRARETPANAGEQLHHLHRIMTRTDARISTTVEHGFSQKFYLVSDNYPQVMAERHVALQLTPLRWQPVTSPVQTDLIPLVRQRLQPHPPTPAVAESTENRRAYETLLVEQVRMRSRSGPRP